MSLGEKLCNARLARKETASVVAKATRMKVQTVEDIEREDFSRLSAAIYAKGFIKLYAEHVGLDPKPLIDEYMARFAQRDAAGGAQVNAAHVGKLLGGPKPVAKQAADTAPAGDDTRESPDLFDARASGGAPRHGGVGAAGFAAAGRRDVGRQAAAAWSGAMSRAARAWGALRIYLSALGDVGVGRNRPTGSGIPFKLGGVVAGAAVLVVLALAAAVTSRCSTEPDASADRAAATADHPKVALRLAAEPAEPYFD